MPNDNNYDDLAKHILWGMGQDDKKDQEPAARGLFDIYSSLVNAGFNDNQALQIVMTMLKAMMMKKE